MSWRLRIGLGGFWSGKRLTGFPGSGISRPPGRTGSSQSALLGFPAVLLRTSTERPEALDGGSVVIGGITAESVEQAIDLAVAMSGNREAMECPDDYRCRNVSAKVVRLIQSYTDIVNRTIWRKA